MVKLRPTMTPEEVPPPAGGSANPARPRRRSRRGGRGRRRPGPRPAGEVSAAPPTAAEPVEKFSEAGREPISEETPPTDFVHDEPPHEAGGTGHFEEREPREEHSEPEPPREERATRPERRDFKPASPAAVTEAIEEVTRVITSLQQVLATMEEILETLELAEVQKTADEREIQSLRNALRQFERRAPEPGREPRGPEPRRVRR